MDVGINNQCSVYAQDKVEIGWRWNNLPKEEKRKFEDEAASANELLTSLKALDSRPRKRRRKIQTRIAFKQITEIVSKFSEEQRTVVKAIGLGGILDLSCTKLNHGICKWLVNNFDPDTHSLTVHGQKFAITESHVEESLGINGQGNIVSMNSVEGFCEMCTDLRVTKGFVEIKGLLVYLLKTTVANEGFKRKFALYISGSFLCPTTKPVVHESLIHLVSDVGAMVNVNWARITHRVSMQRYLWAMDSQSCTRERLSIPSIDRPLLFWGDRQIKDVLRRFKKIGGYMKQGVGIIFTRDEESMEDGKDKTNGKASSSHQIPNVVIHDMKSTLDKVADLLERQTTSTPQGKTHTPKRNYEDGVDDIPFSPSPSPVSGFKPRVALSRGRKRKVTKPTLRRSLRLSNYEPPNLQPHAELKKGPLLSSPYTRDGHKKRKPDNKSGRAQSPILVDDVKFDVNFPYV
ncbi:hypothetical protein Vadar_015285 [Vaccinium darrowii]|uniref:Uncharacterized protein n=1 Tax=Vaccinium darrowii TaxID=229202 RepID=A0ACB7XHN9_9ERIC|nr:hypothetical protein Vadar_015285 [Vaccinium darrowii]